MVFQEKTYSVLIVSASDSFTNSVMPLLPMTDYWPVSTVGSVGQARRRLTDTEFDIVLINTPLPDDFGMQLAIDICSTSGAGVLLLVKNDHYNDVYAKVVGYGVIALSTPTSRQMVAQNLRILCATRERMRRMQEKQATVEEKIKEIRLVNRAKWLLIECLRMTEAEAHRYIEKQAMDLRISKREGTTFVQKVLVRAIAILLALVVDAFFIFFVTGLNPISVYGVMWNGTFMNTTRFSWALRDLSSLLCIAIALAPAFKMRFWNIGGEGQVLIGGLVAALIMVYFGSSLPAPLLFAAMVIGSVLAGAIWAFVPAWFKSRWNPNETLFTLMMNYVATSIVACMTNIMRGQASSLGTLNKATKAGWLPVINGQRYTINIIVVLVLTFAMYAYLKYSKQGYEISVVGESENTARYAGINVSRVMIRTMLLSGAICGLCGFLVVAGKDQTISTTSAGGNGFTAIIVAWLAKFNTFYMMLISFLLIFLDRGASETASAYSLNEYAADIITGIILFFILGSEFFINYRLVWRGHHDGKEGK